MGERKIFLVSRGDYSDYRVEAAFTTRALAEAWIEGFTDLAIEERVINPPVSGRGIPKGYRQYYIRMAHDGEVMQCEQEGAPNTDLLTIWGNNGELCLVARIIAKTKKAAIKIANEKRAQFIALDLWQEYADLPEPSRD